MQAFHQQQVEAAQRAAAMAAAAGLGTPRLGTPVTGPPPMSTPLPVRTVCDLHMVPNVGGPKAGGAHKTHVSFCADAPCTRARKGVCVSKYTLTSEAHAPDFCPCADAFLPAFTALKPQKLPAPKARLLH